MIIRFIFSLFFTFISLFLYTTNTVFAQSITDKTYKVVLKQDTAVKFENVTGADTILSEGVASEPSLVHQFPDSFEFYFAGKPYKSFCVSPHGWIKLGGEASKIDKVSFIDINESPLLAPYWANWTLGAKGAVVHKLTGTGQNRRIVIQWEFTSETNKKSIVQAILWGNGRIDYNYSYAPTSISRALVGIYSVIDGKNQLCTIQPTDYWKTPNPNYSTPQSLSFTSNQTPVKSASFIPILTQPKPVETLSTSDVKATVITINWYDSSITESFFRIVVSTDNLTYHDFGGVLSRNITTTGDFYSYKLTGLLPNTKYYFKIVAGNEGRKPAYSQTVFTTTQAESVQGYKKIPGDYFSLADALLDIKEKGLNGHIVLELQSTYNASNEKFPLIIDGSFKTNAAKTITIRPASNAGLVKISGSNDEALFLLDNASHIYFNGNPDKKDTSKLLQIRNTSTSGSTIKLINGASYDTIRNCVLQGDGIAIVHLGETNNNLGNSYNGVINCAVTCSSVNKPVSAIYSLGSVKNQNKANLVSGNNFYDFTAGIIRILDGNTSWIIDGNSFYQTKTFSSSTYGVGGISISNKDGEDFRITSNFFGGSKPYCKGSMNYYGSFGGIVLSLSGKKDKINIIKGNIFNNISASSANFIYVVGNAHINQNIIGSQDTSHSIILKHAGYGISASQGSTYPNPDIKTVNGEIIIEENKIGGIYITIEGSFTGIGVDAKKSTIAKNFIGSDTVKNSIYAKGSVTGIYAQTFGEVKIHNNLISNLKGELETIYYDDMSNGIVLYGDEGNAEVKNNVVKSISTLDRYLTGINGYSKDVNYTIVNNKVYDLTLSEDRIENGNHALVGICTNSDGKISGTNIITGNFVHSLVANRPSHTARILGIKGLGFNVRCINNIVKLGLGINGNYITKSAIYGLHIISSNSSNVFNNTVYIDAVDIECYRGNDIFLFSSDVSILTTYLPDNKYSKDSICNNIFYLNNPCSENGFLAYSGMKKNAYINFNNYYGRYDLAFYPETEYNWSRNYSFIEWQKELGFDINSLYEYPKLKKFDFSIEAEDLGLADSSICEGNGLNLASVKTDYYNTNRSFNSPADIGAIAGKLSKYPKDLSPPAAISVQDSVANTLSFTNRKIAGVKIADLGTGVPVTGNNMPRVWFRISAPQSEPWQSAKGKLVSGNGNDGSWDFEIDYSLFNSGVDTGMDIEYYFVAQDQAATPNVGYVYKKAATHTTVNIQKEQAVSPFRYSIVKQLNDTIYVGKGEQFTSLTNNGGVFEALNKYVLMDNICVLVTTDLEETNLHPLRNILCEGGNKYNVTIKPADTGIKVINSPPMGVFDPIRFIESDRITIDGSFNGSGQYLQWTRRLVLDNVNEFILRNCILEAYIFESPLEILPGKERNNDIRVSKNIFKASQDFNPYYLLHAKNNENTFAPAAGAAYIEISENAFSNFTGSAIRVDSLYNISKWKITGNHIYSTSVIEIGQNETLHIPINFMPGSRSNGNTLSGNYIGGTMPYCKGSPYKCNSPYYLSTFVGIFCNTGNSAETVIDNNIIRNISWTGRFFGISVKEGKVSMAYDTIGSPAINKSIFINADYGEKSVAGIIEKSTDTVSINKCNISSIWAEGHYNLNGIASYNGNNFIKNNTIGSKLVNYSLVSTNGGVVLGVSADSAIYTEISNNTITNLSNLPYKESYLTAGILSSCKSLITKNKIYNLFSIGVKDASAIGTINGIFISRKYEKDTVNVSENEISGLTGSFQVGVCINDVQSSFVKVSKNSIHNFGRTESAGIYNINSSALIDNNMIALGYDTSGVKIFEGISLFGILTESSLKDEIYFNSVYIGGDSVHNSFSDKTSYAIKINNTAKDIIANNIFFNARSNNTDNGTLRHGAICIVNKKAMLQQNNLYYSNGTGGFLGSVNSKHLRGDISSSNQHLSAYLDEHFVLANPNFKYPAGNRYTTDLHLKDSTTIERMGIVLNTIPYDFDDKVRQNLTPTDIGAHAGNFKLLPKPKAIFTPGDICIGDSLKLNEASTLAISWFWSFGDGNFSWQKNPKHVYKNGGNYPVKLVVKSKYGLADTLVKNVLVDSSCVWPGDANADKIVDQRDILSIGIAYSETGNSRNDTTTTWTGHFAKNWNQNFLNTANFKHADSDGNGTITARDTTAITRNYSKTHNKNFNTTRGKNTDPVLKVEIQNTVIKAGDVLVAYIVLGENALPAKDVYGVALSLEYNHDYFNKPVVSFTNSWLGNNQLTYYNSTNGLDIALTRTDHNNISGSGRLAEIRMKIKDNAQFSQKQLNIEIGNTMIISADEKPVPVRIISDSVLVEGVSIDNKFDDNRSNNLVSIYPNPFYGQTTIAYNLTTNSKVSVTLCDINGKTIQIKPAKQEVAGEYQFVLDADKYNLTSGVYLLKIDLDGLPVYKRIVKVD